MADPVSGMNTTLGIGLEEIEGTPVAADLWFDLSAETCREEVSLHETAGLGANVGGSMSREEQAAPAVPAKIDCRVGMSFEPRFTHLPRVLGLTLGGNCGGSDYVPSPTVRSFTVEVDKVAEEESGKRVAQFAGGKITKLSIKSEAGGSLQMTLDGVARTKTMIAGTAPNYSAWTAKPPMMHHGMTIVSGPAEIPVGQVYAFELEINTGVEEEHFANSLTRICAPAGRLTANGKITVPFNDDTAPIQAKIRNGTRFDLRTRWIGAGSESFDLLLSCKATGEAKQISDRESQKLEIAFKCVQSGATHAIEAILGS